MNKKNILIVGATGAVGKEMIHCLKKLEIPFDSLYLSASVKSAGKNVQTPFGEITIEETTEELFEKSDFALFSAGSEVSKKFAPIAKRHSCVVIDNSSAFRYESDVPLIIPEINPEKAREHNGIIANPNCTTAIAAVALWPLHKKFKIKNAVISTYQSASGAGDKATGELLKQAKQFLNGEEEVVENFAHPLAFNLIPHIDEFQENGYTREEMKVVWETRKIFGDDSINITCTAVRVPVLRAHSEAISIETEEKITPDEMREVLSEAPGVELVDNPAENRYPMPRNASEKLLVQVGRIRQSLVFGDNGIEFFVSGDQLLKGAALNAVQILKLLVSE